MAVVLGEPVAQPVDLPVLEDVRDGHGEGIPEKRQQTGVLLGVAIGFPRGQDQAAQPASLGGQGHPQDGRALDSVEAQHLPGDGVALWRVDDHRVAWSLGEPVPNLISGRPGQRREQVELLSAVNVCRGHGAHGAKGWLVDLEEHPVDGHELPHVAQEIAQGLLDPQIAADSQGRLAKELVVIRHGCLLRPRGCKLSHTVIMINFVKYDNKDHRLSQFVDWLLP
jgi:hypothetical protein